MTYPHQLVKSIFILFTFSYFLPFFRSFFLFYFFFKKRKAKTEKKNEKKNTCTSAAANPLYGFFLGSIIIFLKISLLFFNLFSLLNKREK